MSVRDQKPIVLDRFKGLYDREETDQIPQDHLRTATNVICGQKGINGRDGYTVINTFINKNYTHLRTFQQVNGAASFLLLDKNNDTWANSLEGVDRAAPAAATKLAAVMMFNRQYFCFSDGQTGLSGGKLQVYLPGSSWVYRDAAGASSAISCAAAVGAAGKCEIGTHIITVVYETDTGFITPPNTTTFVALATPGATKIDLTVLPIGPAGTAKRRILCSKRIATYSGNPLDYKLFFVPTSGSGTVNNNTAVAVTIDFYDSALIQSADYLLDLMSSIPSGAVVGEMNGRLLVAAPYGSGWICYMSRFNDPESISSVDGFILSKPGVGGNIKSYLVDGSTIYIFKDNRTLSAHDNGQEPANWQLGNISDTLGTVIDGLSTSTFNSTNSQGVSVNTYQTIVSGSTLVANYAGLFQFNGGFSAVPLTWKISRTWQANFSMDVSVSVDVVRQRIYVLCPAGVVRTRGPNTAGVLLVADYSEGLTPDAIKWHVWNPDSSQTLYQVFVYSDGNTIINNPSILLFAFLANNTQITIVDQFNSTAIAVVIETADLSYIREQDEIVGVKEIRVFGKFSGTTSPSSGDRTIAGVVIDSSASGNTESKNFLLSTGSPSVWAVPAQYLQFKNTEQFYLRITMVNKCYIGKIVIYGKQVFTSRPQ